MGDDEPTGEEAEAQREETVMPWLWLGLGLVLVAGFVVWMFIGEPSSKPQHAIVAPSERPAHSSRTP
jgi:hypothetical protein